MATPGKITVVVVEAKVTHDTNNLSTMDPYVVIKNRYEVYKT